MLLFLSGMISPWQKLSLTLCYLLYTSCLWSLLFLVYSLNLASPLIVIIYFEMNLNRKKKNVRFSKRRHILIWPSFNFFFRNRFFKKMQKEECILILLFRDRLVYQLLEVSLFYLDNFESKVKLDLLRQLDIRRQIIRKYYLRYVCIQFKKSIL